jgi:hypothetical protein
MKRYLDNMIVRLLVQLTIKAQKMRRINCRIMPEKSERQIKCL